MSCGSWTTPRSTLGLLVGEGLETTLTAARGFGPAVWACLSAGNLASLPVLDGVECLTVVADHDLPDARGRRAGQDAAARCAERWAAAGREVRVWTSPVPGAPQRLAAGMLTDDALRAELDGGCRPNGHAADDGHAKRQPPPGFDLERFNSKLLVGAAPPIRWLIDGTFRLGELAVLAAMGAAGKSLLLLALALLVIQPKRAVLYQNPVLGGEVVATGSVVLFCAEDNRNEVWRRIEQLDPGGQVRHSTPHNLYIVTVPDLAEPIYIVRTKGREVALDRGLDFVDSVVRRIPDLVLAVVDPIQPFCGADLNQSAEAVQVAFNALSALAARTGAAFILAHHMRKNGAKDITSPEEAREAVRGSGDIVNRPRLSYALWPASQRQTAEFARALAIPARRNLAFYGAVVKANGAHNGEVQVYVRSDTGLLVDRTAAVRAEHRANAGAILPALAQAVARAAATGRPFMRTGQAGLHARRSELPESLRRLGRDRLESLADQLLNEAQLVLAIADGTAPKWLDVPDGAFARGEGSFEPGAPTGRSGRKRGGQAWSRRPIRRLSSGFLSFRPGRKRAVTKRSAAPLVFALRSCSFRVCGK